MGDVEAKVWCCQVSMSKNYKWLDIINFGEKNENDYNDYAKKSILALYWSLRLRFQETNTGKFGKWFSGNHFPSNKQGLNLLRLEGPIIDIIGDNKEFFL